MNGGIRERFELQAQGAEVIEAAEEGGFFFLSMPGRISAKSYSGKVEIADS
jgi:hypothetical protein